MLQVPVLVCDCSSRHNHDNHRSSHHPVSEPVPSALHHQVSSAVNSALLCCPLQFSPKLILMIGPELLLLPFQPIPRTPAPWWRFHMWQMESPSASFWTRTVQTSASTFCASRPCRAHCCESWLNTALTTGRSGASPKSWTQTWRP